MSTNKYFEYDIRAPATGSIKPSALQISKCGLIINTHAAQMNAHSISDKIFCARNSNNNNLHVLNRIHETETLRRQIGRDWAT